MEGVLDDMGLDDIEIERKLEDHKKILEIHEQQIGDHEKKICNIGDEIDILQLKNATYDERFDKIDTQFDSINATLIRFETNYYQSTNSMMNILSSLVVNTNNNNTEITKSKDIKETEIITTRSNNNTKITLKILAIIGGAISAVLIGYFALKGVTIPKLM